MIEKTKQLVESKYTMASGYSANAKVRGHTAHCPGRAWSCAWQVGAGASWSHTPTHHPRWCTATLILSCAGLVSPLWLRRWL